MTNETSDPLPLAPDLVPGVRIKAALLLVLLFSLLLAAGLFLLKSRGFFDPTQRLVLVAHWPGCCLRLALAPASTPAASP